jgi:malate dehydrogenase (quinone)
VFVHCNQRVTGLVREPDGRWKVTVTDTATGDRRTVRTRFVFVGAGGGALPLLQRSGIPEIKGFGGFPVSGKFLRTRSAELVGTHQAKVYGKAAVGAPPMSVPHLDLRLIDGDHSLMFGPYAGFSPRFLKAGSMFDLPLSVKSNNLGSMLGVARTEMALTRYLVKELLQSPSARHGTLTDFVPTAEEHDWDMVTAGQRVQVIKRDPATGRGVLQFGTELVVGGDGSIAGLLGASPGASTAVAAMLDLLERCFPDRIPAWRPALQEAIPSYGRRLSDDPVLLAEVRADTMQVLELNG